MGVCRSEESGMASNVLMFEGPPMRPGLTQLPGSNVEVQGSVLWGLNMSRGAEMSLHPVDAGCQVLEYRPALAGQAWHVEDLKSRALQCQGVRVSESYAEFA